MAGVSPLQTKLDFWIKHGMNVLFVGKHGVGKCLGKGTPVLLYSGRVVPVEKIIEGNLLMGPDGRPRKVLNTAQGQDGMFRITPTKGEPFVCNAPHILTLKMAGSNEAFDIPLNVFLRTGKTFQRRAMLFRTGVNFPSTGNLPEPLYLLGLWLGDGRTDDSSFTATEEEILGYLCDYANWQIGRASCRERV